MSKILILKSGLCLCIHILIFSNQAFEHLVALELVCPAESGGVANSVTHHQSGKVMKEYQPMVLMLAGEQVKRAVQSYPNCPTEIARWGTSSAMAS